MFESEMPQVSDLRAGIGIGSAKAKSGLLLITNDWFRTRGWPGITSDETAVTGEFHIRGIATPSVGKSNSEFDFPEDV
jgi:hypothetical protein